LLFWSEDGLCILREQFEILPESIWHCEAEWTGLSPPAFESRVISDISDIFAEFQEKQFFFFSRASHDDFGASEFQEGCNGNGNTLSDILDTKGDIFDWKSGSGPNFGDFYCGIDSFDK
jgi:hypothetical protein